MIGWWPGDDSAEDIAGTSDGTLLDGASFSPGKVGQAFSFDGVSRHVEVADHPALTPESAITIDAWFTATYTGNYQFLVNKFDHNNGLRDDSYDIGLIPGNGLRFQIDTKPGGGYADNILEVAPPAGINPTDGNFHFIVGTYDGSTMKLYIDGVLAGTRSAAGPINKTIKPLLLGAGMGNNDVKNWFQRGLLDEVELFDRALSQSEVQALYAAGSAGKCKAPTPTPEPTSCSTTVTVPGTANPYLAGMPAGSTDGGWDSVPANSPVLVAGIQVAPGSQYTFSATGAVHLGDGNLTGPDGLDWYANVHYASNGIGGQQGPANALIGVFLDDSQPNTTPDPFGMVNMYIDGFNNTTYSPELKKPFFIGDGKTAAGVTQTFIAPPGATRLFLGTQDGYGWFNNGGSFKVVVAPHLCVPAACNDEMTVPGTSNPWLAGMPAGSTDSGLDSVPTQSPVLVSGVAITPGAGYTFEATGGVHYVGGGSLYPPDGFGAGPHAPGASNGIAPLTAPWNSLVGVYLDDSQPSLSAAPAGLDFTTAASRDYTTLSPQLKQPFFIGDGLNSAGAKQTVVAPAGASRLYLGTMDGAGWYNNVGFFTVKVTNNSCQSSSTPPPTITVGPAEGSLVGPGASGQPGVVHTTFGGTGNAGCTIRATVDDPDHGNVGTYTTMVDASGHWSMDFDLHDCDPTIEFVQVCGGVESAVARRHIYVDGTPPEFTGGGPATEEVVYVGGGSNTATLLIDGSASDPNTYHCAGGNCGGVSYEWHLLGGGGSRTLLGGGGSAGTLTGGGSGLEIDLQPGGYDIEVNACDAAGNCVTRVCHRVIRRTLTLTGGLPEDGGIMSPASGYTAVGGGGRVRTRLTGKGEPNCAVEIKVSDPSHAESALNNTTYTAQVDASGDWALDLELDDCHPVIEIRQVCDGGAGEVIRRQVYVDTTPPSAGLSDREVYVGAGGSATVVLDPGASDDSHVPSNGLTYRWFLVGGDTRTPLCAGCAGVYELTRGAGEYVVEVEITDTAGNVTTKRCVVRILKRPTEIICANTSVDFAGLVTLNYTLRDRLTGEVLTKAVKYKLNGEEVPATFEAYLVPGLYHVAAEFAGDEVYQSCTADGGCPLEVRSTPGKITGGGSIDERLRNFGFVVQTKSQQGAVLYTGSLEYQDKAKGYTLKSRTIQMIAVSADRRRGVFTGTATLNGAAGYTFTVWVDDLAEPGAQTDKFRVQISGPGGVMYDSSQHATLEGTLDQGGNVQIHKAF
jgi:hypothetical protein